MRPHWKHTLVTVLLILVSLNATAPALADNVVVGDGTAGSCTVGSLQTAINNAALNGGGTVTFNCGGAHTIPVTTTLTVDAQSGPKNVTIDGGGLITLDGQNARRIITHQTWGNNGSTLTLQNLTLTRGLASGATSNANGGAIRSHNQSINLAQKPVLNLDNVTFSNNTATLSSGASYDYGGAAIYSQGGFVNVSNSTFAGNTANNAGGGAIHILQSGLTIAGSTFTDNTAGDQGGAIYVDGVGGAGGVFSITGSTFSGSRARNSGGAIYVNMYEDSNSFTVDRSSFINNGVLTGTRAQGGAICGGSTAAGAGTGNASITITNSLFADNIVGVAGGLSGSGGAVNFNQRARVIVANTTFHNNRAEGTTGSTSANGGAIVIINNTTQFQIINSTISNNFARWVGGGITSSANGVLKNTILAYNTASGIANFQQHCSTELAEQGFNLQYPPRLTNANYYNDVTCFAGKSAPNQTGLPEFQDPLLSPLANNGGPTHTRALQPASPAIDTGSSTVCAAAPVSNLDQRGQSRPIDGDGLGGPQCDVGAFEFVPDQPPFAPSLTLPADGATLTGTTATLTWAQAAFAAQYRLQVDDDSNFSSPIVDETLTGTSFTPPYLGVGTFSWRVEATNVNGSAMSATRTFTLASAPAAAPTRDFTTGANQTLTWSALTWATGYQVEVATDAAFGTIVATSPALAANTFSYTLSLPPGIYYWRVKGQQANGIWGAPSAAALTVGGS